MERRRSGWEGEGVDGSDGQTGGEEEAVTVIMSNK